MKINGFDEYRECKVLSNEMISNTTAVLKIERFFSFKAGQCINLKINENIPPRMYSICSAEQDNFVQILYKIIFSGQLTPLLKDITPGKNISISMPFGKFTSTSTPSWFIATGTGIAPFLSMILSGNSMNKRLIHGTSNLTDFYSAYVMEMILGKNYIRCYNGNEKCNFIKSRVINYLDSIPNLPLDNIYYLCGSAEMVVDIRDLLIGKGISFQNIHSEIFF